MRPQTSHLGPTTAPQQSSRILSRVEIYKENIIIVISFLTINGHLKSSILTKRDKTGAYLLISGTVYLVVLLCIYFFLPSIDTILIAFNATNRFPDLRHAVQVVHFLFAILSAGANFTSIYLCWRAAKSFSRVVCLLLIADSLTRGCYSISSILWYYEKLSQFISFLYFGDLVAQINYYPAIMFAYLLHISGFLQIALSLNRFFALSFNGLYYLRAQKYPWLQILIPILLGIGLKSLPVRNTSVSNYYFIIMAPTISFDFMLIYKMIKTKTIVTHSSERYLLAQIMMNNFPTTFVYLLCPFVYLCSMNWLPIITVSFFHIGNLLFFTAGQFFQGMVTIYLVKKGRNQISDRTPNDERKAKTNSVQRITFGVEN